MANRKPRRKTPFRFTIRIGIVMVFVSIFLTLSMLILGVVSWRFYTNAVSLTRQITTAISSSVLREVTTQLAPAQSAGELSARLLATKSIESQSIGQLVSYTTSVLSTFPRVQMAYWGDKQGNFVIARREDDDSISSEVINRRSTPPQRYRLFRKVNGEVVRREEISSMDYDPRKRPWYQHAVDAKEPVWSSAYVFYSGSTQTVGITHASPLIYGGEVEGVFGIDLRLRALSRFLANIKISETGLAFIINKDGELVAYPGDTEPLTSILKIDKPWVVSAYHQYQQQLKSTFSYVYAKQYYHATVFNVPGFERYQWKIFVIVPDKDITGPIWKANLQTLFFSIFVLLGGIIFISFLSRRISRPIRMLAADLERVKEFDIDDTRVVDSRVKEIYLMSVAIQRMKIGLQSFRKYVPRALVQKLILRGEAAMLGGRATKVTLMFTDIANFTSIAESTSTEDIMVYMCEYFDVMGKVIEAHQGNVDKFIGDAVMAFWGAPEADQRHTYHACVAALECQQAIDRMNQSWVEQGRMPLPTRIGLHCGEAIVGNLGSHDRLNYTAIGDTVNIASRLETLNKVYETRIIVSEDVFAKVKKHFIFRRLDKVVVKGRVAPNTIYELLDFRREERLNNYKRFLELFDRGLVAYQAQLWDEAILAFEQVLVDHPEDTPSRLFIERCRHFKTNPVASNWNGVWIYHNKDK